MSSRLLAALEPSVSRELIFVVIVNDDAKLGSALCLSYNPLIGFVWSSTLLVPHIDMCSLLYLSFD